MRALPPFRRPGVLAAATLAACAALAAAACSSGSGGLSTGGDTARGEVLFKQKCGSCHALAAAGTVGVIGPNLDDAFASDREQGFEQSSIQQVVAGQIRTPSLTGNFDAAGNPITSTGTLAMPADLVTGDDVDSVAAYVASVAGKPGAGGGSGPPATSGRDIFTQNCGSCHTLDAAGTRGAVGPNLDESKPSTALVIDRVTNGKNGMPPFKGTLTDAQIKAVAGYVSSSAGK